MNTRDAELNLLKAVIARRSFDQAVFRGLRSEHFRDEDYGRVWADLRDHHHRYGIVPAQETVLADHPELKDYLLNARAPEPAAYYADQILEAFAKQGVATRLVEVVPTLEDDVSTGIDAVIAAVSEYRLLRSNIHLSDLANTASERLRAYQQDRVYGLPFGWPTLDDLTQGAHPGDLIVLVARPGSGKTFLTLKAAHTAWRDGAKVLVIATEVPALRMLQRVDALHLGLDYSLYRKHLLSSNDRARLEAHLQSEDPAFERFVVVDALGSTPSAIASLVEQVEPDMLFIDSFYRLNPDGKFDPRQNWQRFAHLSNEIKDRLAMRFKIPVMVNTQFHREVGSGFGNRKNVEGGLENIAEGDALGKAADLVLGVIRGPEEIQERVLCLRIIKGREVEDGRKFYVDFDFSRMTFNELEFEREQEEKEEEQKGMDW